MDELAGGQSLILSSDAQDNDKGFYYSDNRYYRSHWLISIANAGIEQERKVVKWGRRGEGNEQDENENITGN